MKIELLTTFLEVSRTLHFRISAENLFLTQSAVSARIKLLEEDLGVLLFDRSQKQLRITPEGNRLVKHANELIFMWQKAKQEVSLVEDNLNVLSIGSMASIWDIVLQTWINKISKNIEDISFFTQTYNPLDLKKSVINGVVDIAFTFEALMVDELTTQQVTSVPLHLVTADPDLAEDYQSITDFIMVDYGESVNLQYAREFPDSPPAKHYMGQPRIALDFILENGGCAYLPRQIVTKYIGEGELFLVEEAPVFSRDIFALYLKRSHKKELINNTLHYFPEIIFE